MFVEIYTREQCPNCDKAKQILNSNHTSYVEYTIGKNVTREEVITKFPFARVVPIIVVDGQVVEQVQLPQLLNEQKIS